MSAEAWAKIPGTLSAASCAIPVFGAEKDYYTLSCVSNGNCWHIGFSYSGTTGVYCSAKLGGAMQTIIYPTDINDKWLHIVMTYDGASLKLYVNGELKGTESCSGDLPNKARVKVFIGRGVPKIGDEYHKIQDECILYNRALDKGEVADHYNMGAPSGYPVVTLH